MVAKKNPMRVSSSHVGILPTSTYQKMCGCGKANATNSEESNIPLDAFGSAASVSEATSIAPNFSVISTLGDDDDAIVETCRSLVSLALCHSALCDVQSRCVSETPIPATENETRV